MPKKIYEFKYMYIVEKLKTNAFISVPIG